MSKTEFFLSVEADLQLRHVPFDKAELAEFLKSLWPWSNRATARSAGPRRSWWRWPGREGRKAVRTGFARTAATRESSNKHRLIRPCSLSIWQRNHIFRSETPRRVLVTVPGGCIGKGWWHCTPGGERCPPVRCYRSWRAWFPAWGGAGRGAAVLDWPRGARGLRRHPVRGAAGVGLQGWHAVKRLRKGDWQE
jgi:hypothetical protein